MTADPFAVQFRPMGMPNHRLSAAFARGEYPGAPEVFERLIEAESTLTAAMEEAVATAQTQYIDWVRDCADGIVAGRPLPKDVLRQGRKVIDSHEENRLNSLVVGDLREMVEGRWAKALREHLNHLLTHLRGPLDSIVQEVRTYARTVAALDLSDPVAVATADGEQRAALARLDALRRDYIELRKRQRSLIESAHPEPGADFVDYSAPQRSGGFPMRRTWAGIFKTHVHAHSAIPTLGAPEDPRNHRWYVDLLRDDVWIPTYDELAKAYRKLAHHTGGQA